MRSLLRLLAVLAAVGMGVAGCGDDSTDVDTGPAGPGDGATELPTAAPAITGTVTAVAPFVPVTEDCTPSEDLDPDDAVSSDDPPVCTPEDNDIVGTVLVEEHAGIQEGRKISFTVTLDTVLADADGSKLAGIEDLHDGDAVEAWVQDDVCAESYPEQCGAAAIRRTG